MTPELQRILHVEDDPSIRLVTSLALEKVGKFMVLSCDGGLAALEKAGAFDPQVLLLDVRGMPVVVALHQQDARLAGAFQRRSDLQIMVAFIWW